MRKERRMRERKKEGERDFNLGRKVWMKHIRYFFVLFLQLFCKCETMIILNVKKRKLWDSELHPSPNPQTKFSFLLHSLFYFCHAKNLPNLLSQRVLSTHLLLLYEWLVTNRFCPQKLWLMTSRAVVIYRCLDLTSRYWCDWLGVPSGPQNILKLFRWF